MTCTTSESTSNLLYQVSNANRLWSVNSVQLQNVLIVPTLESKAGRIYHSCTNLTLVLNQLKHLCVSQSSCTYNSNCHNEIITVLLFCDLSCKVQGRDDLTCCCSSFLYIKDNSREGSCSCCFSKQACGWVTWFAQRYTYRDYVQGKF